MPRDYYHLRAGPVPTPEIDEQKLRELLRETISSLQETGFFQDAFGYHCVDRGPVPGRLGRSMADYLLTEAFMRIEDPVADHLEQLTEHEILALHEVLFHVVAKPLAGSYHDWSNCGWHYRSFDQLAGQSTFLDRVNSCLRLYPPGYVLTPEGRLELLMTEPEAKLLQEPLPSSTPLTVAQRVQRAVERFRNGLSTWDEREAAVRDLGDALEYIRPEAEKRLSRKDEASECHWIKLPGSRIVLFCTPIAV